MWVIESHAGGLRFIRLERLHADGRFWLEARSMNRSGRFEWLHDRHTHR